jgi:5-methylcytosine-specific restriction endonuclease McrA
MRRHGRLHEFKKCNLRHGSMYGFCKDCLVFIQIYGRGRCKSCYQRWYLSEPKNKKRHAELMRQYRKERPEMYNAIEKQRRKTKKRKDWEKAYRKKYYKENKEKILQYQVDWRKNNKEKYNFYMINSRNRRSKAEGFITEEQWNRIVSFYSCYNQCICCGLEYDNDILERKLTIDHVVPIINNGTHWPSNIQPLCYSCNSSKGHRHETDYRFDEGDFARSLMND